MTRVSIYLSLSLSLLGPIIINSDGTTRRIANWDEMSKREQEVTWKRIAARNKKRLEDLKKEAGRDEPDQTNE